MTTLFDMTRRLAFKMMPFWSSEATGGGVTSLVDSLAAFAADQVGGVLWVYTGDLANKSLIITSVTGTTQLNFATQTPNDIVAGNLYAVTNSDYKRAHLRSAVNEAIRKYGKRRDEDITLVTVADQEEYTLPTGVSDVKEVWLATATAAPYGWVHLNGYWEEIDGELVFPAGFAPAVAGYKLKVVFPAAHEDLDADADTLPLDVNEELIFWDAVTALCSDGNMRFHDDPKRDIVNKMNEAQEELSRRKRNWNPWTRDARPARY